MTLEPSFRILEYCLLRIQMPSLVLTKRKIIQQNSGSVDVNYIVRFVTIFNASCTYFQNVEVIRFFVKFKT